MARAALALLLICATAAADEPLCPAPPIPADEPPLMPLRAGTPAPFEGVLFSEPRMVHHVCLDARVRLAEENVGARDLALKKLEEQLAVEKQRQIDETWWSRSKFWFGVGLGAAAVGAVVWIAK